MNKKGFTLVELLAVIVVLGLVITITATKGFGAFDNTKKAITKQNLKAIKEAANVLATQIDNCDDDVDSELWTTKSLNMGNNCSELKTQMSKEKGCIETSVDYLISNDYLSDNDDFKDIKDKKVTICKEPKSGKIAIDMSEKENKDDDIKSVILLKDEIINSAKNATASSDTIRTNYQKTPLTTPTQKVSDKNEKTLSVTSDDYGDSYYYRGNVVDNYVNFAGMCWRVVRIQGDGSIKLILEDQDNTCATSDGNWNIPTTTGDTTKSCDTGDTTKSCNFGYTEHAANTLTASDGTKNSLRMYLMNYLNGGTANDTSMATVFKNFQTGPLANYLDKLKVGDWCLNDKAYATSNDNTTALTSQEMLDKQIKGTPFYYDSYVRLNGKTTKVPTLKCNGTNMNKFADNTDMYVGTLTADEIVYAGGKAYTTNPDYYLINDYQKANWLFFWSLSPNRFISYSNYAFGVSASGSVDGSDVRSDDSFRPAVTLLSSTQITGGNGTKANAYTIG